MDKLLFKIASRISNEDSQPLETREAGAIKNSVTIGALLSALFFGFLSKQSGGEENVNKDRVEALVDDVLDTVEASPNDKATDVNLPEVVQAVKEHKPSGLDMKAIEEFANGNTQRIFALMDDSNYKKVFGDKEILANQKAAKSVLEVGRKNDVATSNDLMTRDRLGLELTQGILEAALFSRGNKVFDEAMSHLEGNKIAELIKASKVGNEFYDMLVNIEHQIYLYDNGESTLGDEEMAYYEEKYSDMLNVFAAFLDAANSVKQ